MLRANEKADSAVPPAATPSPSRTATDVSPSRDEADELGTAPDESGYALSIAGVYQDNVTWNWAVQMCRPATRLAGEASVRSAWYHVNGLSDPATLLDAVRATLRADVIVISVHAAEELPLELCVWIDAWLSRRPARAGALAALIGVAEQPASQSARTQEYLQAVARKGQLDFVPQERELPAEDAAWLSCSHQKAQNRNTTPE